jgi:hypothetical protein
MAGLVVLVFLERRAGISLPFSEVVERVARRQRKSRTGV